MKLGVKVAVARFAYGLKHDGIVFVIAERIEVGTGHPQIVARDYAAGIGFGDEHMRAYARIRFNHSYKVPFAAEHVG